MQVSPAFSFSTDAKMWRKIATFQCLVSYRFIFFFHHPPEILGCVCNSEVGVCGRGRGESCWRNRSRKAFLLSCILDQGEEGCPCSPAAREERQALLQCRDCSCSRVGAAWAISAAGRELFPCRHSIFHGMPYATSSSVIRFWALKLKRRRLMS